MPTVPLSEVKAKLTKYLNEVQKFGEHVVITRSGRPAAVLMGHDEYEGLLETLDILADEELMAAIKEAEEEIKAGKVLSYEEFWNDLDVDVQPPSKKRPAKA